MLEPIINRKNHTLSSRHCSERLGIAACRGGGSERLGIAACHLLELLLLAHAATTSAFCLARALPHDLEWASARPATSQFA